MSDNIRRLDRLCIDTIRTLSMDAVQRASSGHPGTPMGLAPVAYTLWQRFLRYDPTDPGWPNRDRFVLSAGHASMLLYSLLHLAGVEDPLSGAGGERRLAVSMDDIMDFRQLGSRCPGHPEYGVTAGVETTTGPLGQGVSNSVGMAIGGRWLAARYNRPDFPLFDFDVYAVASDGDMMEGVSSEAASLAGHLRLSNLCWLYDNNHVSIEGSTDLAFSDDVPRRFEGHGWKVTRVGDANDLEELSRALELFRRSDDRPTLIVVDSHIAYGSPGKQDSSVAHGAPLGEDEVRLTKRAYGWPEDSEFLVPDGVREHFEEVMGRRGRELRGAWASLFEGYRERHPDLAEELSLMWRRDLPAGWDRDLPTYEPDPKGVATRVASGEVLNVLGRNVPWLLGGSADLAPSNKSRLEFMGSGDLSADNPAGRNMHFGVRENAMAGIANGLCLTGLRPYGATFLVFSDYARPAIRLGALMGLPVVYVFTHDSIGLGEDGPTHQPVEHLASLRAMPGIAVVRPADANEVVGAWRIAMEVTSGPVALVLTRQSLPVLDRGPRGTVVERGAYVLVDGDGTPDLLLIASGSEVHLCVEARTVLEGEGHRVRVVSMPSWEFFERQPREYRDSVIPPDVTARVTVEAGSTFGWERYAGSTGEMIGLDRFGASAPGGELSRHFGFTVDHVLEAARRQLGAARRQLGAE